MKKKALTYLTIMAITLLPVQLISANVESAQMQMSMQQAEKAENGCMHAMDKQLVEKDCCAEQSLDAHNCQNCSDCPQALSISILPSQNFEKNFFSQPPVFHSSHLTLSGISQNNLLRPPRV